MTYGLVKKIREPTSKEFFTSEFNVANEDWGKIILQLEK